MTHGPVLIRTLWSLTWSFGQRRQVLRLWVLLDTHPAPIAVRNCLFWVRNPGLLLRVRRLRSAWANGQDILEA